jgi:hypothetical protein
MYKLQKRFTTQEDWLEYRKARDNFEDVNIVGKILLK